MGIDIFPSFIASTALKAISDANELIRKCTSDIDIGVDDINLVANSLMSDNQQKLLDVIVAVFSYSLRNRDTEIMNADLEVFDDLSSNLSSLANVERALHVVVRLRYITNTSTIKGLDRDAIYAKLEIINTQIIDVRNKLIPGPGPGLELNDADLRLAAVVSSMLELFDESNKEVVVTESVKTMVRHASEAVANKVVKFSVAEKELSDRLNDKFNRFLDNYKADKKTMSYEKIVKDSVDLSGMIKNLIGSSIVALLIPGGIQVKLIAGALVMLVQFAQNKRTEAKHRGVILNDLKFELKIVQEKIRDAESKGDIDAKYKLMRIENQISRAIDRINFRLSAEQH